MVDRSQLSGGREGTTIIGVDCAAQPNNTGIARGEIENGRLTIRNVERGNRRRTPAIVLREWLGAASGRPTLLALDAPLGWPVGMGTALHDHRAGRPIEVHPDYMFKRITDRCVKEWTGKNPLEVGASWIARTAHSALGLLACLRDATNEEIPLMTHIEFSSDQGTQMVTSDDLVDAVLCVQAGFDFLCGRCVNPPEDEMDTVRREGWIWFQHSGAPRGIPAERLDSVEHWFLNVATHNCDPPIHPVVRKALLPDDEEGDDRIAGGGATRTVRAPNIGRSLLHTGRVHQARPHAAGACPAVPASGPRVRV